MNKDVYVKTPVTHEIKTQFLERCAFLQKNPSRVQRELVENFLALHKSKHEVDVHISTCTFPQNFAICAKLIGPSITENFAFEIPWYEGWIINPLTSQWATHTSGGLIMGLVSANTWQARASRISESSVPVERLEFDLLTLFHRIAAQANGG